MTYMSSGGSTYRVLFNSLWDTNNEPCRVLKSTSMLPCLKFWKIKKDVTDRW